MSQLTIFSVIFGLIRLFFSLFSFLFTEKNSEKKKGWFALLLTGYVDGAEPLDELKVALHLRHPGFQLLSVGLLRHGLRDQREALVLMVQLVPGLLQTLDTDTGHLQQANITHAGASFISRQVPPGRPAACPPTGWSGLPALCALSPSPQSPPELSAAPLCAAEGI